MRTLKLTCLFCADFFLLEPEKLVHHILQDIYKTKKKKTRVILRMLPISGTCKAFLEDMKNYAETFSDLLNSATAFLEFMEENMEKIV